MSTYLINHMRIPNGIPKPEALVYLENVEATFVSYGGRWLVLDAQVEVLEGGWPGSVVVMEFPDVGSAKRWYNSPEYQRILRLRTDNVISDVILVEPVAVRLQLSHMGREDPRCHRYRLRQHSLTRPLRSASRSLDGRVSSNARAPPSSAGRSP